MRSLARRPVVRRLLVLAPAAVLLAGCGGATADAPAPATSAVAPAADQADPDLGVDAFAERVAEEGTVVLDVRTPAEFAQGHLPGAVNIDLQSADFPERIGELDQDERYAVYCQSGNRSGQALATMVGEGFSDVAHLQGGIGAWQAAGLPVVTG